MTGGSPFRPATSASQLLKTKKQREFRIDSRRDAGLETAAPRVSHNSRWQGCCHRHYHASLTSMTRRAILILSIFLCQSLQAAAPGRSVSPSHQFIIYGGDATLRGAVSELAERTKANLLSLLRQPDRWKTAMVINLQPEQANLPEIPPADLRLGQTGSGMKLQLDLTIAQNLDAPLMERELLRAILLEMIYRKESDIPPGVAFVEPPDWLLDGVLALTPGRDRAPLVEALSVSQKTMSFEEFLRQRPELLDSAGRTLYRAYSFALVQLLVDGIDGRTRLARYIDSLPNASNDRVSDLKARFPLLAR